MGHIFCLSPIFAWAELLEKLNLGLEDSELEEKLEAMVKGDIISQGASNFRYRGIDDDIFDKVFRGVYGEEIENFDVRMIREEYSEELEKLEKQYNRLLGKFNVDIFARAQSADDYSII